MNYKALNNFSLDKDLNDDDDENIDNNDFPEKKTDFLLIDSVFNQIAIAYSKSSSQNLIECLNYLSNIYQNEQADTTQIAKKYAFLEMCIDMLTVCPDNNVIITCLNCIHNGFISDPAFLSYLSDKTFAKQLTFSIDEKGSILFIPGFRVLSQIISGYSKKIFDKMVYIFHTTCFSNPFTNDDINSITGFALVFLQLSKFIPNVNTALNYLQITKELLLIGVINYSVKIFLNLASFGKDITIKMCQRETDRNKSRKFGLNEDYKKESIITILFDKLPSINNDETLIDSLNLVITILSDWLGMYQSIISNINIEFFFNLMFSDNLEIQSLAIYVFSFVLKSEIYEKALTKEFVQELLGKISEAPYTVRSKAFISFCEAFIKCNYEQISDIIKWNAIDFVMNFLNDSDDKVTAEATHVLLKISQGPPYIKESLYPYIEEIQEHINSITDDNQAYANLYLCLIFINQNDEEDL